MNAIKILPNCINGQWSVSITTENLEVINPASAEVIAKVPLSTTSEANQAIEAAADAFITWRRTPLTERVQYLFKLKNLLEEHFEDLAQTITQECGKTLAESKGEMRRAIENVEVACGIPIMMLGTNSEDIARGIDEMMIRQPLGVCAVICPFNFPGMIPFWFLPYALACGNTYIVKPSEKVPLTMQKIFQLLEKTGLPKGVVNLVNGAKEAVDAILDHPQIRAISFVGSTTVAKYIYSRGAANGKRMQCQGGAKNPIIILPDADIEMTTRIAADSAFGCAGQRCLAASIAVTVGEARQSFSDAIAQVATNRVVGNGLDQGVEMGPVISAESRTRIEGLIEKGKHEGASLLVDGRNPQIAGYGNGYFIRPTILQDVNPAGEIAKTEIFGPVLSLMHVNTIDQAISLVNNGQYGNMACLFTNSGAAARKFRYEAEVGNIGINIGVAAPMAFFPFSGWKESFFGDLHGQGNHAVEFFTQTKVVKAILQRNANKTLSQQALLWQEWLKRYPDHPGADDATYRLARILQDQNDIMGVMHLYMKLMMQPVGDDDALYMGYPHVRSLLDVGLTIEQIAALIKEPQNQSMLPLLRYALSVRYARMQNYALALQISEKLDLRTMPKQILGSYYDNYYWLNEKPEDVQKQIQTTLFEQRKRWQNLLTLQQKNTSESQYQIATNWFGKDGWKNGYMAIWDEYRAEYLPMEECGTWWVCNIKLRDVNTVRKMYEEGSQNGVALVLLKQVTDNFKTTPQLREKALYMQTRVLFEQWEYHPFGETIRIHPSAGTRGKLQKYLLGNNYNYNDTYYKSVMKEIKQDYQRRIDEIIAQLQLQFPQSKYIDSLLFNNYFFSGNPEYLQRIVKLYPHSDRAESAKFILEHRNVNQ